MRRGKRKVPVFELYGERTPGGFAQRLHIEDIQSRSHRYRWEIAAHTHRGLQQCVFVLQGPADVQIDDERSSLRAPAIVLLPPASVHAFRFSAETRGFVLTVAPEALASGDAAEYLADFDAVLDTPQLLALDAEGNLPRRLQLLFERLAEEFRQPDSLAAPLCLWLARSALWLIAQEAARHQQALPGSPRQHRWLGQFRALVESHYAEHCPVARYARPLGLTDGRLNRRSNRHYPLLRETAENATFLARANWPWAKPAMQALMKANPRLDVGSFATGLNAWDRIEEWEDDGGRALSAFPGDVRSARHRNAWCRAESVAAVESPQSGLPGTVA